MNHTEEEVIELKKTFKGKFKLWLDGMQKFREDPPIYRIHMMQGLMVRLTIYMIIFACIYAISIGFWVFALILLPVGTIGNYYTMKGHLMKYKPIVKQYEMAGMIKQIDKDISKLRRKWRIIEKQIGFFGLDIIMTLFTLTLCFAYFGGFTLWVKLGIVVGSLIPLWILYFQVIYRLCNWRYKK